MQANDKRLGGPLYFRGTPSGVWMDYEDGMTAYCRLMNSYVKLRELEKLTERVRKCRLRIYSADIDAVLAELYRIEAESNRL